MRHRRRLHITVFTSQSSRSRRRLHVIFTLASFTAVIYVCKQSLDVTTATTDPHTGCPNKLIHFRTDVPLIWIGGVPRSGTTLMRVALDAHSDIECGAETRVIPRMLSVHAAMERSDSETAYLNAAGLTNDTIDGALAAYILTVLTRHGTSGTAAHRLCNKDPFTLRSMQRLVRLFPRSKFVLMIRDGRAVADSIVSGHVTIRGFDVATHRGALADWNRAMSTMFSQCMAVSVDRCLPVYYEQLVLEPREQLRRVLEFLGIDWNEAVLSHEKVIDQPGGIFLSEYDIVIIRLFVLSEKIMYAFYPRDAMHSAVFASATCLSVCLSVRPSVTRWYCA